MFANSLARILVTGVLTALISACGGGGGGGGGTILNPDPPPDPNATTGSITVTVSGMVDEDGNPDSVLSGNEVATVTAEVRDNNQLVDDVVVTFSTDRGNLLTNSATTQDGVASVEIAGDGSAGAATVRAQATLASGEVVEGSVVVQSSEDAPTPSLVDEEGAPVQAIQLAAAESETVKITLRDWNGRLLRNARVKIESDSLQVSATSGTTNDQGELELVVTGKDAPQEGVLTITAVTDSGEFITNVTATSLGQTGGGSSNNRLTLSVIGLVDESGDPDSVLSANEAATLQVEVIQDGAAASDVVVTFTATGGGKLLRTSATSDAEGMASVQLVGDGTAGTIEVQATARLSNGINVESSRVLVQSSSEGPTLTFVDTGETAKSVSLVVGQEKVLNVQLLNWNGQPLAGETVTLTSTAVNIAEVNDVGGTATGETNSAGMLSVVIEGRGNGVVGNLQAESALTGLTVNVTIPAETRDVDPVERNVAVSISGMVDANGSPDSILAGNETATVSATVTEDGQPIEAVVLFTVVETRPNLILGASAATNPSTGVASVNITGDGQAGIVTINASATFPDGVQQQGQLVVQTSADAPKIRLLDASSNEVTLVELFDASTRTLTARLLNWNNQPISGSTVRFTSTQLELDKSSGTSDSSGDVSVTLTGTSTATEGTFTATATAGSFSIQRQITANSLGVDEVNNKIALTVSNLGSNGVLDGAERALISATVTEDGSLQPNIAVTFTLSTPAAGDLVPSSAVSNSSGVAQTDLFGRAVAGAIVVTANATLSNGSPVSETITVQASSEKPAISLLVKDANGNTVTAPASLTVNQEVSIHASIPGMDADDTPVTLNFAVSPATLGTFSNATAVTNNDNCSQSISTTPCATMKFTSGTSEVSGTITVTADITPPGGNAFALTAGTFSASNSGTNSGVADDDSFTITRNGEAVSATVAVEGDNYNNRTVSVQVDLADFFNNPVPDGTEIEFRSELGDISSSCTTTSGSCSVTFTSADPRTPTNTEKSFKNVDDNGCPDPLISETVTLTDADGDGSVDDLRTKYRVKEILLITSTNRATSYAFTARADGAECATCAASVIVNYERMWLDEEVNDNTTHVIFEPGVATEPFLDRKSTPCLAPVRNRVEQISGSIDPGPTSGTTTTLTGNVAPQGVTVNLTGTIDPTASATVVGVGTMFNSEVSIGDYLSVSGEISRVTAVTNDTTLTVSPAFTDTANDATPDVIKPSVAEAVLTGSIEPTAASTTVTGVGTSFTSELRVGDTLVVNGVSQTVTAITNNTSLTVGAQYIGVDPDNDTSLQRSRSGTTTGITGSVDPDGTTTVTGVGTLFSTELAVNDLLLVNGESRTVTAIASNTSLTVNSAFTNSGNDSSPTRLRGTLPAISLTGQIDPAASTTVTGNGTRFLSEVEVGDLLSVSGYYRRVTAIASDTSLTVSTAFVDAANDTTPQRVRGQVTGINTRFTSELVVGDQVTINGNTQRVERITSDTVMEVRAPYTAVAATATKQTSEVTGVGTKFLTELMKGDFLKVSGEIREVVAVNSDTKVLVASPFSDNANDVTPERIAAPAYNGGLGQPYGGRSTVLAYAVGEESFVDANGNDQYDSGETFVDLPEPFLDKNEDGVFNDTDSDSASGSSSVAPYRNSFTGSNPKGQARDKSNPKCIGPKTVGSSNSLEANEFCHQEGGDEELFVDVDSDGVWDVGNGIYNGSRCINQPSSVCTTTLVNIFRQVQILMSNSFARTAFRAGGSSHGAHGRGEFITALSSGSTVASGSYETSSYNLTSNNGSTITTGTDFTIGNTHNATTVFAGVSERNESGQTAPPNLTYGGTSATLYVTDLYGGDLADGATVRIDDNATDTNSCELASVNGITSGEGTEFKIGSEISTRISFSVKRKGTGGTATVTATIKSTPSNDTTIRTLTVTC